uniref:Osteoclast-stimulating factor 1 n=1 Tax=Myripristis murdjan TaxID=586833 RepID=A0A668AU18_9TELE
MKDPMSTCSYNLLYQNVKRYSKNGEYFCKELMTVFQQRAELELTYSKGLQKLAGKLIKASKGMTNNSTYIAWCHVSDEMYSTADTHRALGNAFQQEAILELRQALDEHNKRKRPLDSVVEKTGKLVASNWSEQIKIKKKLVGITREHEALFNFVENNKQICTEKEKQKMLNRLTKSAEAQTRVDEEYFNINMEGHQIRLKWENTLKNCFQIIQELEKQRIEILCNMLNRYSLHMSSFGQTLIHGHKQIEQAIQRVDMEKDMQTLVEETSITTEDNKAEFLMADYFEEDSKSLMGRDRRREAIKIKLQRLEDSIAKTKKDCEGIERLMKTYSENPSFSNQKNLEETEQLLDEVYTVRDFLKNTFVASCRLNLKHKTIFLSKDCEHSVVQLTRPVKIRKTSFRSRQTLRASIIYKGPVQSVTKPSVEPSDTADQVTASASNQEPAVVECETRAEWSSIGKCKALYDFTSEQEDELNLKEGDLLDIYLKEDNGWWYGALDGQIGHFPSSYVEELPVLSIVNSSDA